jgi:excisionase family DNA binding protein
MLVKRFYRIDEAAERLMCSQQTIRAMIKDGRLGAYKPNERYLIPVEAVEKLLEKTKIRNE